MPASLYSKVADLPLKVEGYSLEGLELIAGDSGFERLSTVIRINGAGEEGIGEDVTYDALDHIALQDTGPVLELSGEHTLDSFSKRLEELDLFPAPASNPASINYRRWAFESAALDLGLRQAGTTLFELLGMEMDPVHFVCSMRLAPLGSDEPSRFELLTERLAVYPNLRFKLDPTNDWNDELIGEIAATGAVDSLDLKGQYSGTPVDVETDPELYAKLIAAFPQAWLEDPDVNEETRPLLDPVAERITWDAPIHSVEDIESRPWKPKMVNIKPSRFGPIERLFAAYDYCRDNGIRAYGGGQWELGPGRGQIQYLASLFHPDTPNDTAPGVYNSAPTEPGHPPSPLPPEPSKAGFRWGEWSER